MRERITISPDVLYQELSSEAVLLHLPTERYFGLNEVGCRVWRFLERGLSREDVVRELAAEYDAPEDVIRGDVSALIEQLSERKLLVIEV